jgi:chromosome segregation ATPase
MSVNDTLKEKQNELEALQKAYDDFIESSKEFEGELEQELKDAADKLTDVTLKKSQADTKLLGVQEKVTQLSKELQQTQNELVKAKIVLSTAEESKKSLENNNESLLDKVRILETTEG